MTDAFTRWRNGLSREELCNLISLFEEARRAGSNEPYESYLRDLFVSLHGHE
jgi:hypothetical protein